MLRRYTENVVVLFDSDESGVKAAIRSLDVLLEEGVMPHVAPLPEGYDPDSYITQNGVEKFTELIENSSSWVDFYIDRTVNRYREGSLTMNQLLKEIGELLGKVKDPVEFNLGSKKASEKLGVRESEVRSFVKHGQSRGNTGRAKNVSYGSHEKLMLSILLKYPSLSSVIDKENWRQFIENQEIKSIMEEIISGGAHDLSNLLVHFNDRSEQEIISQILLSSDGIDDMETAGSMLASCVSKLKAAKVENRLKAIRLEMGLAAKDKDDLAEKRLLEEYLELMKQK
jgi:DNA primase